MKRAVSRTAQVAVGSLVAAFRWCASPAAAPQPQVRKTPAEEYTAAVARDGVELCVKRGGSDAVTKVWLAPGWLAENSTAVRHTTGQSTATLDEIAANAGRVVEAAVDADGESSAPVLRCKLTTAPEGVGLTCSEEDVAKTTRTWDVTVELKATLRRYGVSTLGVSEACRAISGASEVSRLAYKDVVACNKDPRMVTDVRREFFRALAADGVVLLEGCPTDAEDAVEQCALAAAPVSGMTKHLYGTDFKVNRDPGAMGPRNNIAYSGVFLDLHNDLAYYESMPGLQLLLCRRFDDAVEGGESFFVDAFAAAEDLRRERPDAFDVLCSVPRPFCKDDPTRKVPACYYYGAPHISVNPLTGHVKKVVWAPAFEAPFPVWMDEGAQRRYYDARRAFAAVLLRWRREQAVRHRLRPGECFMWNQVRMLHGREAFVEPEPGMRTLHGCYVNIDDFASSARHVLGDSLPPVALANGSDL